MILLEEPVLLTIFGLRTNPSDDDGPAGKIAE